MKISDVVNITQGECINTPVVQAIESATVFPSKVEAGELFFAARREDIPAAVAGGAYAIVFEGEAPDIVDTEIAWISVDSVKEAAFRLLRYVLLGKDADLYLLNPHEMTFLKMILKQRQNIVFLPPEWMKAFESILNSDEVLFVSADAELMHTISADTKSIEESEEGYMVADTLFRSTFKIDGYIYQNREMAPFHLEHLLKVLHFCKLHQLPYSLDRIRYTKHFDPVFVDSSLTSVPKGGSDRVVIFCDNTDDILKAGEYVKSQSSWAKSIVLTPTGTKLENRERPIWFSSIDEARDILKKGYFNYAFVYSCDRKILKEMKKEYSLF